MNWNDHSRLEGKHSILSPSSYQWIRYSADESREALFNRYRSEYSQMIGTVLHEYACKRIKYRMRLKKHDKDGVLFYLIDHGIPINVIDEDYIFENLLYYVNDAIGYRMDPEVVLYYSDNCFGTTDAISFSKNLLRIHDLKTGRMPAHIEQLQIYAALFCLEYGKKPGDIEIELRMYQPDNLVTMKPELDDIVPIMDAIISHDKYLMKIQNEGAILL